MATFTNANNEITMGGIVDAIQNAEDYTSLSLTQYTKRSTIMSRVYIEKVLAGEEILTHLMLNIMNLYTGLILTALDMNRYISNTKRIRDAMSVVATESFSQMPQMSDELLAKYFAGTSPRMDFVRSDGSDWSEGHEPTSYNPPSGGKVIDPEPKMANLPSGRIIEVKFGNPKDANTQGVFTINLFLQLLPLFIPTEVSQQFVGINFTPSIKQRWMQASAGEISMVNDFLLGLDMRKKRMKALKNDKTGALKDMVERQENNLQNSWLKFSFLRPEKQNIANTILIFEKNSFDKACSQAGLRWKDYNKRQQFFNKTFAMILCTVDPMYNRIEMFYHGLPAVSQFTFDQVKRNGKTEQVDLMSIMKSYAAGMAPKF